MNITKVTLGILAALTGNAVFAQQPVDTLVTNGKILTVDANFRVIEALAINDGRDDRFALQPVRDARMGGERSRRRR